LGCSHSDAEAQTRGHGGKQARLLCDSFGIAAVKPHLLDAVFGEGCKGGKDCKATRGKRDRRPSPPLTRPAQRAPCCGYPARRAGKGDGPPQRRSKGLKSLKGLKGLHVCGSRLFAGGVGEGTTFTSTFTGAAAPWLGAIRPSPQRHHATPRPTGTRHPAPGTRPCAQGEGKAQREVTTNYCMRPRQATGQTEAMTPSRMPKSDSWRCTAWSV
jgi:hypothetical protein